MFFLHDFFQRSNVPTFGNLELRAYLRQARRLASEFESSKGLQDVGTQLSVSLSLFNFQETLSTDTCLEIIWSSFLPSQPVTVDLVKLQNAQDVADDFDDISWGSGLSIARLVNIRNSMASVLSSVVSGQGDTQRILKVSSLPNQKSFVLTRTGHRVISPNEQSTSH